MNAVGANGLALYNYGQTVSIPFFTETWRPSSWLERIMENWRLGLHTLCLLDIKVKEQSEENLARYDVFLRRSFADDVAEGERYTNQRDSCLPSQPSTNFFR